MESIAHHVRDIETNQKRWLEERLGYRLKDDQVVVIRVLNPGREPSAHVRQKAMDEIQAMISSVNERAAREGITTEEADAAVEAAIEDIRRGRA